MKKALITGLSGQDGSYLAEYLLALGYSVYGLVRRESGSKRFVAVPLGQGDAKVAVAWTFYQDSTGRIWIGTVRQGVYVVDPKEHGTPPPLASGVQQPLLPQFRR